MLGRKVTGDRERETISKAKKFMPAGNGNTVAQDIMIRDGKGPIVWDMSGNEYIDYLLGSGPMVIGHAHPDVVAAVVEQIERGSTFFAPNDSEVELAEEIVNAVPCAEQVRFLSSGTEATQMAMRVARAYRKREKILKFEGGFHGMNDYSLMSLAPSSPPDFPKPSPDSAGIPQGVQSSVLVAPFNDLETTIAIIDKHHNEIAGVIVEPMQRVIPPKPGFLQGLRDVTLQYEIPLIFDEIVTGFRFAYGGGQEYYGVIPDLCTLGKAVSGGFPMSAVVGRSEMMAHFDSDRVPSDEFMPQVGTLNGNPVAAIAGLETLKVLRQKGTYEKLFQIGQSIKDGFQRLLNEAEIPAKVIGEAPMFDILFTDNEIVNYRSTLTADKGKMVNLNKLLIERGVFKGDVKYYVSTVHTEEHVKQTLDAFESALQQLPG
ncbi:aminotransferase class III-fold pyridoxal phosphate-dependent enzyme [Dehalococcoidia bacterium]|nr:aminotransferase class III-fold pyridoxal phosphate-dependent enzyme [Dehalococcoidia bacterium]